MNEQTKSIIRHALTAIGVILGFIGLSKFVPIVEFLQANLDQLWAAISLIIGLVTTLIGFFKNKERFVQRTQ